MAVLKILAWVRLLVAFAVIYWFFFCYLFEKYSGRLSDFDQFNWRHKHAKQVSINQIFGFSQTSISGQTIKQASKNSHTHVGTLSQFLQRGTQSSSVNFGCIQGQMCQRQLPAWNTKKVDSYFFNFYNWYRIQFTFIDLGYDSYLEFRLIEIKKGTHQISQRIPFMLPDYFYARNPNDTQNRFTVNLQTKGLSLNISQFAVGEHYNDPENDGLENERLFHLTPNKTSISQAQYLKFGSAKTLTQFNFTFQRNDYQIKAFATHVIRHNQCTTSELNGVLRHKCMGGYGKGKLTFSKFIRQNINPDNKRYTGNWERNSYNLDTSRVRTTFVGQRSRLINLPQNPFVNAIQLIRTERSPQNSIEIDFLGFNKLEYYSKRDRIQKERWVGMSLYSKLDQNGSPLLGSPQNYFFVNGNIHPIHQIDFTVPFDADSLQQGKTILFSHHASSNANNSTPSFQIEFEVLNRTLVEEKGLSSNKKVFRVDGYWKGWIDEGTLFSDAKVKQHYNQTYEFGYAEFYEIMGTIKLLQE